METMTEEKRKLILELGDLIANASEQELYVLYGAAVGLIIKNK